MFKEQQRSQYGWCRLSECEGNLKFTDVTNVCVGGREPGGGGVGADLISPHGP